MRKCVLLVIPPVVEDERKWYLFPIGIAYVSSSLKKAGFHVKTLNLNYKKNPIQVLKDFIIQEKIDIVGTGGLSTQYADIKDIVRTAKEINSDIITMVGGGLITGDPVSAMQALEYADYGMIGEGEITSCELVNYLENMQDIDPESIDGLIFRKNGEYHVTKPRQEILDLDSIPFPDYEGFEYDKVVVNDSSTYIFSEKALNTAAICGSRSCIYNCTFCFHSSGKKYRQRSIENIFQEIDWLIEKYPIEQLFIVDELFASDFDRLREFCSKIKTYNLAWIASLRVDIITQELLEMLKECNCKAISFGLESADNRILKSMRKNITIEQISNALMLCQKVGVLSTGTFIFGDIEETIETYHNTLEWWKAHPEYYIKLSLIVVYPGSYLYKYACKNGLISDPVQFLKDGCPILNLSKLTDAEYAEMATLLDVLPAERELERLKDASVMIRNNNVDLTARCPHCNSVQLWEQLDAFRRVELMCTDCYRKFEVSVVDYVDMDNYRSNIRRLLARYKRIAIWPRTISTYNMLKHIPELHNEDVYLVDKSRLKQDGKIFGKCTYAPDIIARKDIPCVIINIPTNVEGEIERTIRRSYPNVKCILMARELITPLSK